jgi:hypothetical protein
MVHALGSGDGECSSVHGTTSLLLTAPRPAVRALDREADRLEAGRLAGDSAFPTGRCGIARLRRGTRTCPAARSVTFAVKIVREIREQFGSAAGNREVMTEDAPAFAQWRPTLLPTCLCDPGRAILCSLSLPLRPLQWP